MVLKCINHRTVIDISDDTNIHKSLKRWFLTTGETTVLLLLLLFVAVVSFLLYLIKFRTYKVLAVEK